jgi:hypothetical protein
MTSTRSRTQIRKFLESKINAQLCSNTDTDNMAPLRCLCPHTWWLPDKSKVYIMDSRSSTWWSLEVGNIKMIIFVYKVEGYGINLQIIYAPRAPLYYFGLGWQEDHCLSSSGDLEVLSILVSAFLSSALALYPMLTIETLCSEVKKKRIHVKEYLWSND